MASSPERRSGVPGPSKEGAPGGERVPLRPRSLVFDLYGDYIRYVGGEARLRALTSLLECFGVGQNTGRVVMSRLRAEGWFDSRRVGRETAYTLNAKSWRLLDEGRSRIFERADRTWDHTWHMVIYSVPETDRALRDQLRRELSWLGFGALASSTWISPWNRLREVEEHFAGESALRLDLLGCKSKGIERDRDMAVRCWDLEGLNADYEALLRMYRGRMRLYRSQDLAPEQALIERMQLVHDYRRFPFRDPDLPKELLPPGWVGREAHALFVEAHDLLQDLAEQKFREIWESA
jgi:phenylacetic acid degradation operon negative regulatory protein